MNVAGQFGDIAMDIENTEGTCTPLANWASATRVVGSFPYDCRSGDRNGIIIVAPCICTAATSTTREFPLRVAWQRQRHAMRRAIRRDRSGGQIVTDADGGIIISNADVIGAN